MLVVHALCGVIAEELLSHGISGRGLVAFFGRPWQLACGNAFLFMPYHGNLTQGLLAFPLGFALPQLKAYGGLHVSVTMHLSVSLLMLRLQTGRIGGKRIK